MNQGMTRVLTALVGIPLVLAALWWGGWLFWGLMAVAALAAQWEFLGLARQKEADGPRVLALVAGALILLRFAWDGSWAPALAGAAVLALTSLRSPVATAVPRFSAQMASLIYPVGLLSLFVDIRWRADAVWGQTDGFLLVLLLFVLIWVTDSGAYYTGRSLGRTKFAPETSPNKTWEGTLGGLAMAVLTAVLFKLFWLPYLSWADVTVLAAIGGFWAQLGDLLESSLKRSAGVKDSGSFLPGHGGMLDRFDSLIMAAPAYWLWLMYGSIMFGG